MAPITTGTHPKLLWPGVKAFWGNAYKDQPLVHTRVFDQDESTTKPYEETVEMAGFGLAPVKPEAASISYDTTINGYTTRFTHVAYALGFIVSQEAVADNQYKEQAERRAKALKRSMRHTKEWVHANILNRATDSNYVGGDGVSLLNASHPTASGNQSNVLSVAADLSEAALEDILIMLRTAKDTRGLIMSLQGKKLIVAPNEEFNAERILKSTLQNDTANNAINAMRSMGSLPEGVQGWSFLTDADQWFVKTDADGLKTFTRNEIDLDKDGDFDTGNFKHKAYMRFAAGWDDWRAMYGSPGTG
jgi:hypothetical protein